MAHTNAECGAWVIDLLEVDPRDSLLEVGFGPGVTIERLSNLVVGHIAGIDPSPEMIAQTRRRKLGAIRSGRIELRQGTVDRLPFDDDVFDKALAINSMQVSPDAVAGLREMRRVMKSTARIALGFTPYSGQTKQGITEMLKASGFTEAHPFENGNAFAAVATKA
jgi:ubiquinone/menaquinone biosynthesis C-methylase UbiE